MRKDVVQKQNTLLLTSVILVTFFLGEILIRASNIVANYSEQRNGYYMYMYQQPFKASPYQLHLPNSLLKLHTGEFSYKRKINSLGFSFKELPVAKRKDEIRIMALGDSFTEGDGAPADSTWMKSLEANLKTVYPCLDITFINAGVCGSDPVLDYRLFKDKLQQYKPDFLIDVVTHSDMDDIAMRGGFERFIGQDSCRYKQGPWWENVYAVSHLFRLGIHTYRNRIFLSEKENEETYKKSVVTICKAEYRLNEQAKESKTKFIAVTMPVALDFLNGEFSSLGQVNEQLKLAPFPVISLYDCYRTNHNVSGNNAFDYYWKIDGHHNGKGYQIFGECVADYFISNKLLEPSNQQ